MFNSSQHNQTEEEHIPFQDFKVKPWEQAVIVSFIMAGIISTVTVVTLLYIQNQQQQNLKQQVAEFQAREEQLIKEKSQKEETEQQLLKEKNQREETERQLIKEKSQREETEQQLIKEKRQREETERQLREKQLRKEEETIFRSDENINEGEAISLIENLYYQLSEKNFNAAGFLVQSTTCL